MARKRQTYKPCLRRNCIHTHECCIAAFRDQLYVSFTVIKPKPPARTDGVYIAYGNHRIGGIVTFVEAYMVPVWPGAVAMGGGGAGPRRPEFRQAASRSARPR